MTYKWTGTGKPMDMSLLGRAGCTCERFNPEPTPQTFKTVGRRHDNGLWECAVYKLRR